MKKSIRVCLKTILFVLSLALCGCASGENRDMETSFENLSEKNGESDISDMKNNNNEKKGDVNKKAILVVSFGTSYNESREKTIGSIEKKIAEAFPDYDQRRAFTSQTIIDKIARRDNEKIDNVKEAMEKFIDEGYGSLIIQPTHVMNGEEYDEMRELTKPFEKNFVSVKYGKPLLTSSEDYKDVIDAVAKDIPMISDKTCAVVFMGHGTNHFANATYSALDYRFKAEGYENVFVGTVEGYPHLDKIKKDLEKFKPKKVTLIPFMIVAGDHAKNDMAGDDPDSWYSQFAAAGFEVEAALKGLGEYPGIRRLLVEHLKAADSE